VYWTLGQRFWFGKNATACAHNPSHATGRLRTIPVHFSYSILNDSRSPGVGSGDGALPAWNRLKKY
jgi:hypothetical protein